MAQATRDRVAALVQRLALLGGVCGSAFFAILLSRWINPVDSSRVVMERLSLQVVGLGFSSSLCLFIALSATKSVAVMIATGLVAAIVGMVSMLVWVIYASA